MLADNQKSSAQAIKNASAACWIGSISDIATNLPLALKELSILESRSRMSLAASTVSDGMGVEQILKVMGMSNV